MYFYFLIEDQSGENLIHKVMQKMQDKYSDLYYDCKAFKGIGGFTQKNTVKETKNSKLLDSLTTYLRGFNKSLANTDSTVVVVLDNDDRNTEEFMKTLKSIVEQNSIDIDHIFAIAVEEMESWLLGDFTAILTAYPNAKQNVINNYVQDSICGTWELLADVIYPGGLTKMKKECPTYKERGLIKSEWAFNIGTYMDLNKNESPSFNYFIKEIERRLCTT